jgi:hypothetical protein
VTCTRCNGTQKLRSGAHCPACTHVIEWGPAPWRPRATAVASLHIVRCSCGWKHMETSRQNALGRAAKMRAAVARHCKLAASPLP